MNAKQAYKKVCASLITAGIESPEFEAQCLIKKVLGLDRTSLIVHGDSKVDDIKSNKLDELVKRRINREPLQYILGKWSFCGFEFEVGEATVNVAAGAGDNAAAAVGTGTVKNGDCNISLGTSGTVFVACDNYKADYENAIHNFCHANGAYHYMACMLSAASCNKWWLEDIIGTDDYTEAYADYDIYSDNGLIFLPYMMGERSPHNDADIRGMFYGLGMSTTRKDMSVAILEGVAFALKQNIDIIRSMGIDINKSRVCGGGTKNKLWLKIMASVLGIELEVPENQEGASFGAALLAAKGSGDAMYDNAIDGLKIKEVITPDKRLTEKYARKYELFVKLYPAVKSAIRP